MSNLNCTVRSPIPVPRALVPQDPGVCIVLLNWNNWNDTIECIKSIFDLNYENYQLVIVDNNSDNDSLFQIERFLVNHFSGKRNNQYNTYYLLNSFYKIISENEILNYKNTYKEGTFNPVLVIKNDRNYGFGKGNNVGLRYALCQKKVQHIWVLNNDTIADKNSLGRLIKESDRSKKTGACGSVIIYHDSPDKIQTIGGGSFYPWFGQSKLLLKNRPLKELYSIPKEHLVKKLDYIMGVSLLIKKEVLLNCGLFDEDYFVYTEELDLIYRIRKSGWEISVATDSIIYHKDSSTTKNKKYSYYYLLMKGNMIFLKKHYNYFYIAVSIFPILINTIRRTQNLKNIRYALKGVIDGVAFKVRSSSSMI